MFRAVIAAGAAVLVCAAGSIGLAQENDGISVRIAKTARAVKPFGTATPGTGNVRVRLSRLGQDGYRSLSSKLVPVDQGGDYEARFDRPRRGECRIVVRVPGSNDRAEEPFPCANPQFPEGRATLTALGESTEIDALIAETDEHRQYGLMYRPRMRSNLGMAFLFDQDASGGFWMKNTLIPLSIAFFDSEGLILRILDMQPCEEDPCPSYDPGVSYRGALEVNQGAFEEWGISEGDLVRIEKGP